MKYNIDHTWEYNLQTNVRWDSEDAIDDVIYFIKNNIDKIIEEEK